MLMRAWVCAVLTCMVGDCAFNNARTAHIAQQRLIGWSELELESVLERRISTDLSAPGIFSRISAIQPANKGVSLGLPFIAGMTIGGGGYCHAIFRVREGRV